MELSIRNTQIFIYELLKSFKWKKHQQLRLMIHQTESGEPPKKRQNMYTQKNSKLPLFLEEFKNGQQPIKTYLYKVR